jgi:hypothetical protein
MWNCHAALLRELAGGSSRALEMTCQSREYLP